mmetsp:Transcript_26765/g.49170  ORF Transcript_26765/g.49170 Transcript_26765/m.49170 type:complete len:201 (-) Transcript_26765:58-660(-)
MQAVCCRQWAWRLGKGQGQPVKSFEQAFSSGCPCWLHEVLPAAQLMQAQLLRDLIFGHGVGQILLVGIDQQAGLGQVWFPQQVVQLFMSFLNAVPVSTVYNEDHSVHVLQVVTPKSADLLLPTNIPNCAGDIVVRDCLNIESNCGDCRHYLSQTNPVEDGRLTCCIQADHDDFGLLLVNEALPQLGECKAHAAHQRELMR